MCAILVVFSGPTPGMSLNPDSNGTKGIIFLRLPGRQTGSVMKSTFRNLTLILASCVLSLDSYFFVLCLALYLIDFFYRFYPSIVT